MCKTIPINQWSHTTGEIKTHMQFTVVDPGISEPGGHPGVAEFFGSWDCFDAPSHIPYAFVVRVENKIDIINIACLLKYIIIYVCFVVIICKNKPKKIKKGGDGNPNSPVLNPPLIYFYIKVFWSLLSSFWIIQKQFLHCHFTCVQRFDVSVNELHFHFNSYEIKKLHCFWDKRYMKLFC